MKPCIHPIPIDAEARRAIAPVVCYPTHTLMQNDYFAKRFDIYQKAREQLTLIDTVMVPAREARCFKVKAGQFFRIVCVQGAQVGDLNLWHLHNLAEKFYSGKTRALHGTHVSTQDRLWSCFPYLRTMATITCDSLDWYGIDSYGAAVHDVIGTRCDPYTHYLLSQGRLYHHCCHSNLTRALAEFKHLTQDVAEHEIHDVLNVFMCTGFDRNSQQYIMKASPARQGDFLEFYAEIDLLGALSACPGGNCASEHSSDSALCHSLGVEIYTSSNSALQHLSPPSINAYQASRLAAGESL